jgi:hypothetical protein
MFEVAFCSLATPQTSFAARAQPLGVPLATTIDFGNEYSTVVELYDAKITVLEVVRGEKAGELVRAAGASNRPPNKDFEYLLARLRFAFTARTAPGDQTYTLRPAQFSAISPEGKEYAPPVLAQQPVPALSGVLKPGDSREGWVTLTVPRNNAKPLMLFTEEVGTVLRQGSGALFRLY